MDRNWVSAMARLLFMKTRTELPGTGCNSGSVTGDAVAEQVSDYVGPLIDGTVELAKDKFKIFFSKVEK